MDVPVDNGMHLDVYIVGDDGTAMGGDNERIMYFRTLEDYRRLRVLTETGKRFGVIGGGFIGAEMAAALTMNGKEVVMIFPDETIGGRIFPHDVGVFLNDLYPHARLCEGIQAAVDNGAIGIDQQHILVLPIRKPVTLVLADRGHATWSNPRIMERKEQVAGCKRAKGIVVSDIPCQHALARLVALVQEHMILSYHSIERHLHRPRRIVYVHV